MRLARLLPPLRPSSWASPSRTATATAAPGRGPGARMPSSNARWYKHGEALIVLSQGDIAAWSGDALVNAANERMLGGGGVDGAIHRAAGPKLLAACQQVPEVAPDVRCPTGEARMTSAGRLQAKFVIHTVGPIYKSAEESAPLLRKAYLSCLELANKRRLENLAFPAISTGVYGYPPEEAAEVALGAVRDGIGALSYVEFVLHPESIFDTFVAVADRLLEPIRGAGGAAASEPPQQEPAPADSQGRKHTASLHPSSQAAQPTESNSQSDSVCGGGARGGGGLEVTSAAAARGPTPSATGGTGGGAPSGGTGAPSGAPAGPSFAGAPASTVSGEPLGSVAAPPPARPHTRLRPARLAPAPGPAGPGFGARARLDGASRAGGAMPTYAVDTGDVARLRDMRGCVCDLCGDDVHPDAEICVAISCPRCDSLMYHQGCIEKYLKKHGFEMNRKAGFPCPRGRGKNTKFPDECKGKVDKSHPIVPRNEEKKKKAQAPPVQQVVPSAKPGSKGGAPAAAAPAAAAPAAAAKPAKPKAPAAPKAHHVNAAKLQVNRPPRRPCPTPGDPDAPKAETVGLVLEEALTKAQKRNLARARKKKEAAALGEGGSEASADTADASSLSTFSAPAGAGSSAAAAGGGGGGLMGGFRAVTDLKAYNRMLGLSDSDDESAASDDGGDAGDAAGSEAGSHAQWSRGLSPAASGATGASSGPASSGGGGDAGGPAAPPAGADDEAAAMAAAMEASMRDFALQQEMQRQREILSGALQPGAAQAFAPAFAPAPTFTPAPAFAPAPLAKAAPPPFQLPAFTARPAPPAPQPPAFAFGGGGLSWPGGDPVAAKAAAGAAGGHGGYGVVPMAAGLGSAAPDEDDDDDLGSLLELCGVAG
ncbi:macro domain-containing protein [Scenedesmus sp. PABB004]|nr:macro domain-containing protein [Scenedesmus sp. PABB004]